MKSDGSLSLQANIICLLLALIGMTAIVKYPNWFGGIPKAMQMSPPEKMNIRRPKIGLTSNRNRQSL